MLHERNGATWLGSLTCSIDDPIQHGAMKHDEDGSVTVPADNVRAAEPSRPSALPAEDASAADAPVDREATRTSAPHAAATESLASTPPVLRILGIACVLLSTGSLLKSRVAHSAPSPKLSHLYGKSPG